MSQIVEARTAPGIEDASDIPDDVFATLPDHALDIRPIHHAPQDARDVLATLPELPSLDGLTTRLTALQAALDAARDEAGSLKREMREKADALRAIAAALEAM
ncbi:MAG TPA: hypothetical protein VM370_13065 [Candidatus Thermoplasmatota archaeon]|nr:hypothetical protein [Candidatus Thermoplasmatota archaeon]